MAKTHFGTRCPSSFASFSSRFTIEKLRNLLWLALFACVLIVVSANFASAKQSQTSIPTERLSSRAAAGEKLYGQSCAFCHGLRAVGAQAPNLRNTGLPVQQMETIISNGQLGKGMPAFKTTYTPTQISEIVAYIVSFSGNPVAQKGGEAGATSMPGGEVYATYCASCHEAGGAPYLNHNVLKEASPDYITYMLSAGTMHVQGSKLTAKQQVEVAEFITGKKLGATRSVVHPPNPCSSPAPADFSGPEWEWLGRDP